MEKRVKSAIIPRNGTAASWTQHNPVLLKGELGVESDTGKFKFGNGVSAWNQLPYSGGGGNSGSGTSSTTPSVVSASLLRYDSLDYCYIEPYYWDSVTGDDMPCNCDIYVHHRSNPNARLLGYTGSQYHDGPISPVNVITIDYEVSDACHLYLCDFPEYAELIVINNVSTNWNIDFYCDGTNEMELPPNKPWKVLVTGTKERKTVNGVSFRVNSLYRL